MGQYTNRLLDAVYTGSASLNSTVSTVTSQRISGYMLRSLSAVLSASGEASTAGTVKIQVADLPNPLLPGYLDVIPEALWVDMPAYSSNNASVAMVASASATVIAPHPTLGWRWYRFVWTDSGLTNAVSTYTPPTSSTDHIQIMGVPFLVTFNTSATQTVTDLKALVNASAIASYVTLTGTTTMVTTFKGGAQGNGKETFSRGENGASWDHNPSSGGLPANGDTQAKRVYTPATSSTATVTINGVSFVADFDTSATKTVANLVALIQADAATNAIVFASAPGTTLTVYSRSRGASGNTVIAGMTETGNGSWATATTGVTGTSNTVTLDVAGLSV